MGETMQFPNTFQKFIEYYEFKDREQIYTNGSNLISSFRVMQAWNHFMDLFRNAYELSDGDIHIFGHYCKKILKDMEEL